MAEAEDDKTGEKKDGEEDKKPSSPWPSAQKSEKPPAAAPAAAAHPHRDAVTVPDATKAAWGRPLDRLDRGWTKLEARLCAGVLILEFGTLVFWVAIKMSSSTGRAGPGMIFRMLLTSLVVGLVAHFATRKHRYHDVITTVAVFVGLVLGRYWGDAGTAYFANIQAWMQNASILVFFGGIGEVAKRLTLWLALLGASLATGQGKHINVDVVMRFLTPKARVPVAVLGWIAAAIMSVTGAWGFFDGVAVEQYHAPGEIPCANDAAKTCPATAGSKVEFVLSQTGRNLFLARKQMSLDLRTFPRVLGGTPYGKSLTPKEWNEWLREGGWEKRFKPEDVKAFEVPEDGSVEYRNPAVTAVPGGTDAIPMILVPFANLIFAFGLLVIAIKFVLRSLLAISGWVKVDPNAAHGDEELAHAHDHSAQADLVEKAIKETVR